MARRPSSPRKAHNHRACVAQALGMAQEIVAARGLRFTRRRREVLRIVCQSHRPLGAYDVLAALAKTSPGEPPAPPTVYRALDFLLQNGFVHRIDSLSAFVACFEPQRAHRAHFFLCEGCGVAAELADRRLDAVLGTCARDAGFSVTRETVEIAGRCRACRGQGASLGRA